MSDNIKFSGYSHRFLARMIIEAKTPLAVGSGEKDIMTDALVATDANGLPYIPGTAIAGVVRHMIEDVKPDSFDINQIFGFQEKKDGHGSEIIFTEAKILNSKGKVIDGMNLMAREDTLLKYYEELPIRQHVCINERGVATKAGKFDEQVVFAGTRFCFELEMVAKNEDVHNFNKILEQVQNKTFRIGGGTRCGFGEIEVVSLKTKRLDLKEESDRKDYINKTSNLSDTSFWDKIEEENKDKDTEKTDTERWYRYELTLHPEDFFLFGSGFGDDEADMTPVKARKVTWDGNTGKIEENFTLIPATSVKGALAHRVAFYWNKLNGLYIGNPDAKIGSENEAVKELFGFEDGTKQKRGNLLFSDVFETPLPDKLINHVSIDRFTGGAIDGALFQEKTTYGKGKTFTLTIMAKKDVVDGKDKLKETLENAINDICSGMLPLGGGVNRGNGIFNGSFTINGVLYESK